MKVPEVNKMELEYQAEGWALYSTDNDDVQVVQWENPAVGRCAWALHQMLRSHALSTNGIAPHGAGGIIVKRLELINLTVVVRCTANDSHLSFVDTTGETLSPKEAGRIPNARPSRLATMEDVGLHMARSLRAHLAPQGLQDLELRLHFGIEPGGACLLQVPNPLELSLGTTDYESLCGLLT
ncbi:MAG TPA: hypothetical protein VD973_20685 [Symbiobacteriaceae bacterium]|nr:hypothetical protein [Symbiobacteriaceae bacterium]